MAFLYSSYIVMNAILASLLGKVIDRDFVKHNNIIYSLKIVGGYVRCILFWFHADQYF
jgi:hypothetical protein